MFRNSSDFDERVVAGLSAKDRTIGAPSERRRASLLVRRDINAALTLRTA